MNNSNPRQRVLIVEDELIVAENMKETLQRAGYEVTDIFTSAEQLIGRKDRIQADLIIMDVRLSGIIDGVDAAIQIHAARKIPVLFITAHEKTHFPHISDLDQNWIGYLTKPYNKIEFEDTIRTLLQHQKP